MSLNFSLWLPQSAAVANFGISFVDAVATAVAAIPVVVASGFSFFGVVILLALLPGAGAIADILVVVVVVVVVVMVANNQKSIDHCKRVHKKANRRIESKIPQEQHVKVGKVTTREISLFVLEAALIVVESM